MQSVRGLTTILLSVLLGRGSLGNMGFVPFSEEVSEPPPWSPISINATDYYALEKRYSTYLPSNLPMNQVDTAYIRLFRILSIISTNRLTDTQTSSGVWEKYLCSLTPLLDVSFEMGLLFDEIYLSLAHATPKAEWYIKVLAIRDAMYHHWIFNPKRHTRTSTAILTVVCNTAVAWKRAF